MSRNIIASPGWGVLQPLVAVAVATFPAVLCFAQQPDIARIEEDWELVVGDPSVNSDAPQVTCLISPTASPDSIHATFVVNHHDVPAFTAGGLQLQVWNGEELLASQRYPDQAVLSTPGETIRWTQAVSATSTGLVFEVFNGHSITWGDFGGQGTLKIVLNAPAANLNGYDPAVSATNSGVSYAANRAQSLVLKRVRAYAPDGTLIGEDSRPRVVHSLEQ